MPTSDFIRLDGTGRIYLRGRDDIEHLVTTQTLSEKNITERSKSETTDKEFNFKLVTVRRLTNFSSTDITNLLVTQQAELNNIALLTGQPIPFNSPVNNNSNTATNVYGVFIDEDIYGLITPVYIFTTSNLVIKCYITANGVEDDAYSVHIAHQVSQITNPDGTIQLNWRLFSIDSNLNGVYNSYFIESQSLPICFSYNFDMNSLYYLGGGTWTAIGVDVQDRIPITSIAPTDGGNYIPLGTPLQVDNGTIQVNSVVEYSFTPTYSFTWCRGILNLNKRTRSASSTYTIANGIVQLEKQFNYNLNLTQRVNLTTVLGYGKELDFNEFSNGLANYVSTTNDKICSPYQCPDYGTDALRVSLQSYSQSTNCIRPNSLTNISSNSVTPNKYSDQNLCYTPVLAMSNDASILLRFNFGSATGNINHPSQVQATSGSRSYGYSYDYKLWWCYGNVISFYPIGDTNLYQSVKTSESLAGVPVGSMFDLGQLILAPGVPNAVETTWNSPVNPPSGYFEYLFGTLTFIINYNNPPIFGHQSIYYYQINPPAIDGGSADNNYNDAGQDASDVASLDQMQQYYSQILAGMGGEGLSEYDIGNVNIAANETNTLLMREPNANQLSVLSSNPHYFPNKFWTNVNSTVSN